MDVKKAGCVSGVSIHACPVPLFLPSQLGSLELGVKACSVSLWKQRRGRDPRKTYTLWPSFHIATSQSSLFRHTLLSQFLCFHFQYYLHLPINFSLHYLAQVSMSVQPFLSFAYRECCLPSPKTRSREISVF